MSNTPPRRQNACRPPKAFRTASIIISIARPLNTRSIPTNRPTTHNAGRGIPTMIRPDRKSDINALKSTHPHVEDGRMRNAFIILSIPATRKNVAKRHCECQHSGKRICEQKYAGCETKYSENEREKKSFGYSPFKRMYDQNYSARWQRRLRQAVRGQAWLPTVQLWQECPGSSFRLQVEYQRDVFVRPFMSL